jgi:hypothetical protein
VFPGAFRFCLRFRLSALDQRKEVGLRKTCEHPFGLPRHSCSFAHVTHSAHQLFGTACAVMRAEGVTLDVARARRRNRRAVDAVDSKAHRFRRDDSHLNRAASEEVRPMVLVSVSRR